MTKLFTPLLILILAAFCFVPNSFAQKEGLELNKTAVIIPCSPGNPMPAECRGDPSIKVKTTISSKAKILNTDTQFPAGALSEMESKSNGIC